MPRVFVPEEVGDELMAVVHYYAPEAAAAGSGFSTAVYRNTKLSHRIVEAARYRTAQINGCQTCQTWRAGRDLAPVLATENDVHTSFVNVGAPPDEQFYAAVEDWRTSPVFDERERLAIEYAERMGTDPHSFEADEAFWDRMHAAYGDAEIVDLTLSIASWMAMGRVMHVLDIDPQMCAVPGSAAARDAALAGV